MTAVRVTQDNGQDAWIASCGLPTATGATCDYVARNSVSAAEAEHALLTHQQLQPNLEEIGLRPPRDIQQHYPHFVSFDVPNAGQDVDPPTQVHEVPATENATHATVLSPTETTASDDEASAAHEGVSRDADTVAAQEGEQGGTS